MSIVIQTNSGQGGSSYTTSFSQNVRAGSSIIVGVVCNQNLFTSATITDSQGNTYALVKMSPRLTDTGGNFDWVAMYVAKNAVGGADTVTTTFSGTSGGGTNTTLIAELNGPLAGLDGTAAAGVLGNQGDSFPSMSLPVTNAGEFVFTLLYAGACTNGSAPSGYSSFVASAQNPFNAIAWTQTPTPGTDTIQWGGTVASGNFSVPNSVVAASFFLTPPVTPPVQAGTSKNPGRAIQFFGCTPANPSTVSTQSNVPQTFTFDTTSHGGIPVLWRYPDDGNHLGRIAKPGQLLVMPGNGWFSGKSYAVCASGIATMPLSATNSGVSFILSQNNFVNLSSSGLNIQMTSIPLVVLPNFQLGASLNSYQWNFVGSLSGAGNTVSVAGVFNVNGTPINVSGSAIATADEQPTGPKVQLSLAVQFGGSVSGSDQFQSTLTQFEIQEL